MNLLDRPAPTAETVISAVRKAADQGHRYTVAHNGEETPTLRVWTVTHTADPSRRYKVYTNPFAADEKFPLACECPEHERAGYCKHCVLVEEQEGIIEAERDFAEREANRYEAQATADESTYKNAPTPCHIPTCAACNWRSADSYAGGNGTYCGKCLTR